MKMSSATGVSSGGTIMAKNISIVSCVSNNPNSMDPVKHFQLADRPVPQFVGRQKLLTAVHDALEECSKSNNWKDRTQAIVGFGGIGKSELVRKFLEVHSAKYPNYAWIEAETEQTAFRSFQKLADFLQLTCKANDTGPDIAERVFNHVSSHIPNSVFIYDDANRLKTDETSGEFGIFDYLPLKGNVQMNTPLLLITSRTKEWRKEGIGLIEVNELNDEDAVQYFLSRFELTDTHLRKIGDLASLQQLFRSSKELVKNISDVLQGYPLALEVGAAYVTYIPGEDEPSFLEQELRKFYESVSKVVADVIMQKSLSQATQYNRTLAQVWTNTMNRLREQVHAGGGALSLLQILAYCNANPKLISYRDVKAAYGHSPSGESPSTGITYEAAVKLLSQLILVQRVQDASRKSLRIHKMIQKFTRRDDKYGLGLEKILSAKKFTLAESYLSHESEIHLRPNVLLQLVPALWEGFPKEVLLILRQAVDQSNLCPKTKTEYNVKLMKLENHPVGDGYEDEDRLPKLVTDIIRTLQCSRNLYDGETSGVEVYENSGPNSDYEEDGYHVPCKLRRRE